MRSSSGVRKGWDDFGGYLCVLWHAPHDHHTINNPESDDCISDFSVLAFVFFPFREAAASLEVCTALSLLLYCIESLSQGRLSPFVPFNL